ncbi:MAG TPA: GDSL-type esterase/lipase family protein, partial [Nitrososphaeraceae archaeon]|nr:GDSL-type esterase/lipase family protein [Nitrososphaeraceae archaeon]
MVVFGDSIAWGQGLAENEKYSTRLAKFIETRFGNRVSVLKKVYAHSGAKIGYRLDASDNAYAEKFGRGYVMNDPSYGEIPSTFPTIDQQVSSYSVADASRVDLVLLDGGINDIGVFEIIHPNTKAVDLENKTLNSCYYDMKNLLDKIRKKFTNPKTRIVVTGYYQIVSDQSDPGFLISLLTLVLGVATAGTLRAKEIIAEHCQQFAQSANNDLSKAVAETNAIDGNRGRFLFANPSFAPWNAIFTAPYPWIYGCNISVGVISSVSAEDSVKDSRSIQCKAVTQISPLDSLKCNLASVGHPNPAGAMWYTNSITPVLFPIPTQCRSISDEINGLQADLNGLQSELDTAVFGEKAALVKQIQYLTTRIKAKQKSLDQCIQLDIDDTFSKMIDPFKAWIKFLYIDLLNRIPNQNEVDGWFNILLRGSAPDSIADGFLYSQ